MCKWFHSGYAAVKTVAGEFSRFLLAGNVNGILESQWSRQKSYVMKSNTVREITYLGDCVST